MIALREVTVRYGDRTVLDRITLDLLDVGVTALSGPNGSGKTTLGRVLLGLLRPASGRVHGLAGLRRAAVFQEDRLCEQLTAVDNVRLVLGRAVPHSAVVEALVAVGLDEALLTLPVQGLSGGQRRRVALVRALLPPADLVVLDEPFTGLDPVAKGRALDWAAGRLAGRATLLITHDPTDGGYFGASLLRLGG